MEYILFKCICFKLFHWKNIVSTTQHKCWQ